MFCFSGSMELLVLSVLNLLKIFFSLEPLTALKIALSCSQGLPNIKWLLRAWSSTGVECEGLCVGAAYFSPCWAAEEVWPILSPLASRCIMVFLKEWGLSCPSLTLTRHSVEVALYTPPQLPILVLAYQINELSQVPPPVMLLPDDFKASSKIKVNNHLFHRYVEIPALLLSTFLEESNT